MSDNFRTRSLSNGNAKIKHTRPLRDHERKEAHDRKRNLLYLISTYLKENNLHETATSLIKEACLSPQYEICDNIDLDTIFQEFTSYYRVKFNKLPKILKDLPNTQESKRKNYTLEGVSPTPSEKTSNPSSGKTSTSEFHFEVTKLYSSDKQHPSQSSVSAEDCGIDTGGQFANLKPLTEFEGCNSEWYDMAEQVKKEIYTQGFGIFWTDCIGLQKCVELLKEAVIYPLKYPELFTGLITPWRGILLYGPPGTGKTLLAKALASETLTTFINVTSSTFTSKWRGESEKLIKVLFDVARYYAPTTIFIDEIDALVSKKEDYQHEASRRFQSELLAQLDGIQRRDEQVFILASTNSPWEIDTAMLRRFEKRILVGLPSEETRGEIFKYFFAKHDNDFTEIDYIAMSKSTDEFAGSDIKGVCKETCMNLVRQKLKSEAKEAGVRYDGKLRTLTLDDVMNSLNKINPATGRSSLTKYHEWHKKHGCA